MEDLDVLIVGAGIAGIGTGYYLTTSLPGHSFAILEGRDAIGGTWDLFRFPGIRSDSDLFTFGFGFKPWTSNRSIAKADLILDYLNETVREHDLERHIRFGHRVVAARWSSDDARWTVTADARRRRAGRAPLPLPRRRHRLLRLCAGLRARVRGHRGVRPEPSCTRSFLARGPRPRRQARGRHRQRRDRRDARPAMAGTAAHVTMLQRTPELHARRPGGGSAPQGDEARARRAAHVPAHAPQVHLGAVRSIYRASRRYPRLVRRLLLADARRRLPKGFDVAAHFNPPYDPWDQRMCIVPDGDIYEAISSGGASVVTERIDRFTPDGIRLRSGRMLEANIVVTATGLRMLPFGGIALSVDGADVDLPERTIYKSMMLSGVPNFAFVFGYENASWTLKVNLRLRAPLPPDRPHGRARVRQRRAGAPRRRHRPPAPLRPHVGLCAARHRRVPAHRARAGRRRSSRHMRSMSERLAGPVDGPELRFGTRVASEPAVAA